MPSSRAVTELCMLLDAAKRQQHGNQSHPQLNASQSTVLCKHMDLHQRVDPYDDVVAENACLYYLLCGVRIL